MTSNKMSLLGIAKKAGKVLLGSAACENGIRARKIKLLIINSRISQRSETHFIRECEKYGVQIIKTDENIGRAIGKEYIMVVGITDEGFKKAILNAKAY